MCEQRTITFGVLTLYTEASNSKKDFLVVPSAWRLINGLKIDDLLKANDMKIIENINIDLITHTVENSVIKHCI